MTAARDLSIDRSDTHEHSLVRYQLTVVALLERLREGEPWWAEAACAGEGTERFFPPADRQQRVSAELRAFCAACPAQAQCASSGERALAGIWAGRLRRTSSRVALPDIATKGPRLPDSTRSDPLAETKGPLVVG